MAVKSILQDDMSKCFMCESTNWLEYHHVFGASRRKKSDKYGLIVALCHYCHNEPPNGVHHNKQTREELQKKGQLAYMQYYKKTKEEFSKEFYANYL